MQALERGTPFEFKNFVIFCYILTPFKAIFKKLFYAFWTFFYFIFAPNIDNKVLMDYTLLYNNTINGKKNASQARTVELR